MKKMLSILALLMAASMLFWLVGCGGDDDDDDDDCGDNVAPKVASVAPNGGTVSLNTTITVALNKAVDTITITLGGDAITASSTDNKTYTFTPTKEGAGQALAVTAEDSCGDGLDPAFAGATFDVLPEDKEAPTIEGGDCDPKDGASGVDPADVTEIKIVFSEDVKDIEVTSFEPSDANVDPSVDGATVTINFLGGFALGNETEVEVVLSGTDLAGNDLADTEYSFTTMAKEE